MSARRPTQERWLLAAGLILAAAGLAGSAVLAPVDLLLHDRLARLLPATAADSVVVVAIDENSIDSLGRWPWSRRLHATLIDRLKQAGARAIALDIFFAEADLADPLSDQLLTAAMASHGRVVLPVLPLASATPGALQPGLPMPALRAISALGHVDIELDVDGVVRRSHLRAGIETARYPALPAALLAAGASAERSSDAPVATIEYGTWVREQPILLSRLPAPGAIRQLSYVDVLNGQVDAAVLDRALVVVGVTAAGIGPRFTTPASAAARRTLAGVELHAGTVAVLAAGKTVLPLSRAATAALAAVWALLAVWVAGRLRAGPVLLGLSLLVLVQLAVSALAMAAFNVWLAPTGGLLITGLTYLLWNWRSISAYAQSLGKERASSRATLATIAEAVISTDLNDQIVAMNPAAEQLLGVPLVIARGRPLVRILQLEPALLPWSPPASGANADSEASTPTEARLRDRDGRLRPVRISTAPLREAGGDPNGRVIAITDLTDTVELFDAMARQASQDALTGLGNRAQLNSRLRWTVEQARANGGAVALVYIGLDGFKRVNDALGHDAGDALLRMAGERLRAACADTDLVTRWGGDEFMVMIDGSDGRQRIDPEATATAMLAALAGSYALVGEQAHVTASIGISLLPQDAADADELLEHADAAMHRAKVEGGNGSHRYHSDDRRWTRERMQVESELRAALASGGMTVLLQPVVDVAARRVDKLEALVRWNHPMHGLLGPDSFVGLAEHVGLASRLGEVVLGLACEQVRTLRAEGLSVNIAVNVSPRQLERGDLVETVTRVLAEAGLPGSLLTLEITENAVIRDGKRAGQCLQAVRAHGVCVALDDFGTGYSSLALLRELPLDEIKIDRSLVADAMQTAAGAAIVRMILALAGSLDKRVVAEGVETPAQARWLLAQGCRLQQGFLYSKPVDLASVRACLRDPDRLFARLELAPPATDSATTSH